jgi:hypothetical protein
VSFDVSLDAPWTGRDPVRLMVTKATRCRTVPLRDVTEDDIVDENAG